MNDAEEVFVFRYFKRRYYGRISIEDLEHRRVLASIGFAPYQIARSEANSPAAVISADLDGDGALDVLTASNVDFKVAWYRNLDGEGTLGNQRVIRERTYHERSDQRYYALEAVDIDGDADLDVLVASDGGIEWFENTDGRGSFGDAMQVSESAAVSMAVADFDDDDDVDILSGGKTLSWHERTDTGFQRHSIAGGEPGLEYLSAHVADVDGDGDQDVIASRSFGYSGGSYWYKNTDGNGVFGRRRMLARGGSQTVSAADVDGDHDVDIMSSELLLTRDGGMVQTISWHENVDGKGDFEEHVISSSATATELNPSDIDGDGDIDLVVGFGRAFGDRTGQIDTRLGWYENNNGLGEFGELRVVAPGQEEMSSLFVSDLDGDGHLDLLSTSRNDDQVAWRPNVDGQGNFSEEVAIVASLATLRDVISSDLDNDGDFDVVTASFGDDKISVYQRIDGSKEFGPQIIVDDELAEASFVSVADFNGDGNDDILAASRRQTVWYENDGNATFSPRRQISSGFNGVEPFESVFAADIDDDGDVDVIAASHAGGHSSALTWFENTDSRGSFAIGQVVTTSLRNSWSVFAADLDGDGDNDIVSGSPDGVWWFENENGRGEFGDAQIIDDQRIIVSTVVSDVDADGDHDIVYQTRDNFIGWYENSEVHASTFVSHEIADVDSNVRNIRLADWDGDGDVDVLATLMTGIVWYENDIGLGAFGPARTITRYDWPTAVHPLDFDFDFDGDVDFVTATTVDDNVSWYENRPVGDANNDGVFDSADLLQVFQMNEYEDGVHANSTFEEGDWNGDREFDSTDLILAFQAGNYKSRLVAAAVDGVLDNEQGRSSRIGQFNCRLFDPAFVV